MSYKPKNISTAVTTVVRSTPGTLHSIVVNSTSAGAITVYDSASVAAGTVIATLKASVAEGTYLYDVDLTNGCVVVTAGASDITVSTAGQGGF